MKSPSQLLSLAARFEKMAQAVQQGGKLYFLDPVEANSTSWVQQTLRSEHFIDPTEANRGWGPTSQKALIDFQTAHKIPASGHLDEATLTALKSSVSPESVPQFPQAQTPQVPQTQQTQQAQRPVAAQPTGAGAGVAAMNAAQPAPKAATSSVIKLLKLADRFEKMAQATSELYRLREATPEQIKIVQEQLKNYGQPLGPAGVDGKWGTFSQAALKAFQAKQGLPATGHLDPATISGLNQGPGTNKLPAPPAAAPVAPAPAPAAPQPKTTPYVPKYKGDFEGAPTAPVPFVPKYKGDFEGAPTAPKTKEPWKYPAGYDPKTKSMQGPTWPGDTRK
jgi:peptidoglycan hydrolase-like protein with peptidoglycan-binding domain